MPRRKASEYLALGTETGNTSDSTPRIPKPGDQVTFRGWTNGEESLYGIISHATGLNANIAYLTKSGTWLSAHNAVFDETKSSPGSWCFLDA